MNWTNLNGNCKICGQRADIRIEGTKKDKIWAIITYSEDYCNSHAPKGMSVEEMDKEWKEIASNPPRI